MKRKLAVIWAAVMAAGVTLVGVVTGRRRRARAERQKARAERQAKRAQRRAQGGRKRAGAVAARSGGRASASAPATTSAAGSKKSAPANASASEVASASGAASEASAEASDAASEASAEASDRATDASAGSTGGTSGVEQTGDDLQAIKGLGAVAEGKLRDAGVTTYAQIAAWTPEEARDIALRLELQPGRIASDDWVGQARHLLDQGGQGPAQA